MHCIQFSSHDGGVHAIFGYDFGSPIRLVERLRIQGPRRWNSQILGLLLRRNPELLPLISEHLGGKSTLEISKNRSKVLGGLSL